MSLNKFADPTMYAKTILDRLIDRLKNEKLGPFWPGQNFNFVWERAKVPRTLKSIDWAVIETSITYNTSAQVKYLVLTFRGC